MDMQFLGDSSCVKAAGFAGGYLTIEFQDGTIYTYEGVDQSTWRGLKMSSSKGYYFNKAIRNSYSFMEGEAPDSGPLKYIDEKYFDDTFDNYKS
jgi:hypothetical protein